MQAIVTKYLPPTNNTGGRVKATCDSAKVIIPWNHALDINANHDAAAKALVLKLGWGWTKDSSGPGRWVGGTMPQIGCSHFRCYVWAYDRVSP